MYQAIGKRTLDIILSAVGSAVLAPVMAAVGIAIVVEDGWPIIFKQERVGLGGSHFTFLKFRSMTVGTPHVASTDADYLQVTRVGRIIRRANLDELPQLLNVLRGDMSLIGPRPAIPSQKDLTAARHVAGALRVRPGMTGLAQVNSYDGMPETEKVAFDAEYARRVSLVLDLKIALMTIAYMAKPPPTY